MFKHRYTATLMAALLLCLFSTAVSARTLTVDPASQFCFSADDFTVQDSDDGIFLTALPRTSVASVCHGNRILRAGDAIPVQSLQNLTMNSHCVTAQSATIGYYTVSDGEISGIKELKLSILPQKNDPPVAENGELETYRNIANSGTLPVSDPENGPMTYAVVDAPKRGTVELHEDGTFTYTPYENKVGKDSFTFTATDNAGNTSQPGKITVEIKKPTAKDVYADMTGDADEFYAVWMREQGLFVGSRIGGNLCFSPEQPVSRGEFLVMTMDVVEAGADSNAMSTGFADEAETPVWMQPYIVSALVDGMITGTQTEDGLYFRPQADLTRAEAAVMLQNILQLPVSDVQQVSAIETEKNIPVWAEDAAAALSFAGISLDMTTGDELMTRRDAANILYRVDCLLKTDNTLNFYWVQ